jgi:maleylpyruvate isomerase
VLNYLKHPLERGKASIDAWVGHWIAEGFAALETMIASHGGRFAFGDRLTIADCHLVPQVYSAERYGVDCSAYPQLAESAANAMAEEPVRRAHPRFQPDADRA